MSIKNFLIFAAIALLVGFCLTRSSEEHLRLRSLTLQILSPFFHAADRLSSLTEKVDVNLQTLDTAQKEFDRLLTDNQKLSSEREIMLAMAKENFDLRKKLSFRGAPRFHLLGCHVIGRDPASWWNSIYVNRGSEDHPSLEKASMHQGLPVISPRGVVGVTGVISQKMSEVILIVNENCQFAAQLEECREQGIIQGEGSVREGNPQTRMRYIPKETPVKIGEKVFTSGLDGIFPAGLLVGKVVDARPAIKEPYMEIVVEPAFDLSQLSELFIIVDEP
ncbi:MAG: rod shape-determining protein MreC [Verrucomicrobiota bacterium]